MKDVLPSVPGPGTIGSPWEYRSLGLFCKMDVQFARILPLPLMMRLGDVRHEVEWEHGSGMDWKP